MAPKPFRVPKRGADLAWRYTPVLWDDGIDTERRANKLMPKAANPEVVILAKFPTGGVSMLTGTERAIARGWVAAGGNLRPHLIPSNYEIVMVEVEGGEEFDRLRAELLEWLPLEMM